jgi:hypothetical protein
MEDNPSAIDENIETETLQMSNPNFSKEYEIYKNN